MNTERENAMTCMLVKRIARLWLVIVAMALLVACADGGVDYSPSDGDADGDTPVDGDEDSGEPVPYGEPEDCEAVTALFDAWAIMDKPAHACHDWVARVIGRVAVQTNGSAAIWSRRNDAQVGVLVTAMHTLGAGWFGRTGEDVAAQIHDPAQTGGSLRLFLVKPDGSGRYHQAYEGDEWVVFPFWPLYNLPIPAAEHAPGLRDILPRHDAVIALTDGQAIACDLLCESAQAVGSEPLSLFDPEALSTQAPTWAMAQSGELLLAIGQPGAYADLTGAVMQVLDDSAATAAIEWLGKKGDEEGGIAYDAEAEILLDGYAETGMSGSGLFNRGGQLVAILVRGSEVYAGRQIVRAVRMYYLLAMMTKTRQAAGPELRDVLDAWLGEEAEALPDAAN